MSVDERGDRARFAAAPGWLNGAPGEAVPPGARAVAVSGDAFWAAEQVEDLVAMLVDIRGVEAWGGRAVFHGIPWERATGAENCDRVVAAARGRGFELWFVDSGGGRVAVVAEPAQPALAPGARGALGRPVWNLLLLFGTLLTTAWAGAAHRGVNLLEEPARWIVGVPYAVALLLILGVHELGHYLAARRRGVPVSLPYFIPAPFFLGTFGAFIRMGGRVQSRRTYFDVAVAGPLAGLVVAVAAVVVGTALDGTAGSIGMVPSSSFLFALLYQLAGGGSPSVPVALGPVAFAGWLGLLVTALNLLPVGQLDGGHIAYALLGRRRARSLGAVVLGLVVALGVLQSPHWLMWALLIWAVAGLDHPAAWNELVPVGRGRTLLGYATLAVLLAIVLPWPR